MTLKELMMVIRRRLVLVIALPVILAVACAAWQIVSSANELGEKSAAARIISNSNAPGVNSIAASEARLAVTDLEDYTFATDIEGGTNTVVVTIKGPDEDMCRELADSIVEKAAKTAKEFYEGMENPYNGYVEYTPEPTEDEEEGLKIKDLLKYVIVAVLGGLFVAICIAVILDIRKRPVKTPEGVQEATEVPVLELLPAKSGERLLANVRFAAKEDAIGSVMVMPAGDVSAAEDTRDLLEAATKAEGNTEFKATCGAPLSESMDAAYAARDADAVVVTVKQWVDTIPQLESTVAELKLAEAKLVGIVFAQ